MYGFELIWMLVRFSFSLASVNLAFNQPTNQSSVFVNNNERLSSERAVDGFYDMLPYNLSCAATRAVDKEVFWQVALAQQSVISHIHFVFESTTEIIKILQNHRVYISNHTTVGSGTLCYQETRSVMGLINEVYCFSVGKYVTYYSNQLYNGNVALLLICEVEVYGCPLGFYGFQCQFKCSINCQIQPCEPDFGHCIGPCNPGFTGDKCDKVCPYGFYGDNCALMCSSTCLSKDCFNTNGTCRRCVEGFMGEMCDISIERTTALYSVFDDAPTERTKYVVAIGVLAVTLGMFICILIWFLIKYRQMKTNIANIISSPPSSNTIHQNQEEDNPTYTNPEISWSRLKSTNKSDKSIYDSPSDKEYYIDAISHKQGTLKYANLKGDNDPALSYEPLQREGIFPRESTHLYDPICSQN